MTIKKTSFNHEPKIVPRPGRQRRPISQRPASIRPGGKGFSAPTNSSRVALMVEIRYGIYTSAMALSIKSDEADQLARELAAETGETLTEAVVIALRERLDREHARHGASMRMRLARLTADVAALPVADGRTPEDIIGYDDAGLPS
jgi:antitoxin VapB